MFFKLSKDANEKQSWHQVQFMMEAEVGAELNFSMAVRPLVQWFSKWQKSKIKAFKMYF